MDGCVLDAIVAGRLFIDESGCVLTPSEFFFGYHSETDFSMDYLDYLDDANASILSGKAD